jgi:small-conductance mechanosensitive channel
MRTKTAAMTMRLRYGGAWRALVVALLLALAGASGANAQAVRSPGASAPAKSGPAKSAPVQAAPAKAAPAPAVSASPAAGGLTTKELEDLVKTLENDAQRKQFLGTLKSLIAARKATEGKKETGAAGFLTGLSERAKTATDGIVKAAEGVADIGSIMRWFKAQWQDAATRARWIAGLWKTLVVLLAGLAAEVILRLLLTRPRRAVEAQVTDSAAIRALFLAARTLLDLAPLAVFVGVAYGALPFVDPSEPVRLIALTVIYANVIARGAIEVARAVLVPRAEGLRLLSLGTETARYLFVWVRRFVNVGVYGYFIAEAALLFGLPPAMHAAFIHLIGLAIAVMLVVFILQNRREIAREIRGEEDREAPARAFRWASFRGRLADVWHVLAILYVIAAYLIWALEVNNGFAFLARATILTVVIAVVAVVIARLVDRGFERLFRISKELEEGAPGLEARANRYLPILRTTMRVIIFGFAVLAVLQAWGADTIGWLGSPTGRAVIGSAVTILVVLIVAILAWELVSGAIARYLERLSAEASQQERVKRLSTLLPLARNVVMIALIVFVALIVLSELGVNIAPLLAGAGVAGLAIGFGAQTLVKDVITGLFILIEDTVQIGDVVEADGRSGVVEGLSIRTLMLRDLNGNLHTIPFSAVGSVKNMTKGFAYYLFDIGVAYRENTDEVIALLREVDEELRADPDYTPVILAPLDVWGVDRFADSAVIVRARYKTLPGNQWMVGRAFNARMKKKFDERGIEIPFPHITLYYGQGKDGTAPPVLLRHEEGLPKAKRAKTSDAEPPPAPAPKLSEPKEQH